MQTLQEKIQSLLEAEFQLQPERYPNFFVVEIDYNVAKNHLKVFIDADAGVSIDHCARLNRFLQAQLDESKELGETYKLDISSPGLNNPLKMHRQYLKNIGRDLKIDLTNEQGQVEGTLTEVKEESIVLSREEKMIPEGKKKKELVQIQQEIPFSSIAKAMVQIRFK